MLQFFERSSVVIDALNTQIPVYARIEYKKITGEVAYLKT